MKKTIKKSKKLNHDFNFAHGDVLRRIGASFFTCYLYFKYIDASITNWKSIKTHVSRISNINANKQYWNHFLRQIVFMDEKKLQKNELKIKPESVKYMAILLLAKLYL